MLKADTVVQWMKPPLGAPAFPSECWLAFQLFHFQSSFWLAHLEKQQQVTQMVPSWETLVEFLDPGFTWPRPSCCSHWGMGINISLSHNTSGDRRGILAGNILISPPNLGRQSVQQVKREQCFIINIHLPLSWIPLGHLVFQPAFPSS